MQELDKWRRRSVNDEDYRRWKSEEPEEREEQKRKMIENLPKVLDLLRQHGAQSDQLGAEEEGDGGVGRKQQTDLPRDGEEGMV